MCNPPFYGTEHEVDAARDARDKNEMPFGVGVCFIYPAICVEIQNCVFWRIGVYGCACGDGYAWGGGEVRV